MRTALLLLSAALGCTEYDLAGAPPDPGLPAQPVCDDPPPDPYDPAREPVCKGEPVVGTFDPVTEWAWTENTATPGYEQVMATPAVGILAPGEAPVVVFTAFSYGTSYGAAGALVAVEGDGTTRWSVLDVGGHAPYAASGVAIADLGDGLGPAILVSSPSGLLCVNADASFRWIAPVGVSPYGNPAIGDIDGDGIAEIAYGATLVGHDGAIRWVGAAGVGGYTSFFANIDGRGDAEIVAGNTVYASDGSVFASNADVDGYSAVADLEGDGLPEVVVVASSAVRAWSPATGETLWSAPFAASGGGAPTIADLDGDGLPEIGAANSAFYQVFDGDGAELWRNAVQDLSSQVTSSSVFDFEGDGAAEIVYADELTLWVYDGATGAVEMAWESHSSGTLYEYPVIVDIDLDGSAEILVPSNDYTFAGSRGITAIGDANGSWAPARAVWNQFAYDITNVADDGTIPAAPVPSWTTWNSFRAGNSETASGLALPDLAVGEPDICDTTCDETVTLWVPVENQATRDVAAVEVAIRDAAGAELGLGAVDVAAGATAWAGPFEVVVAAWDAGAVEIAIDPDDRIRECDEHDGLWAIEDSPCP